MDFHKNQSEAGKGVNMLQTFTICFTSDTHGHIFPVNYAANHYEDSGLLNLMAAILSKVRPLHSIIWSIGSIGRFIPPPQPLMLWA